MIRAIYCAIENLELGEGAAGVHLLFERTMIMYPTQHRFRLFTIGRIPDIYVSFFCIRIDFL